MHDALTGKLVFGILSIIPAVVAYTFYFRDMFVGKTKPHTFSWLIWGILAGNGFIAQVRAQAGIGSFFALNSFSFLTVAYPVTAMLANASVVAMIYARRSA